MCLMVLNIAPQRHYKIRCHKSYGGGTGCCIPWGMNIFRVIIRETFFVLWIQLLVASSFHPSLDAKVRPQVKRPVVVVKNPSKKEILAKSELSYRAFGG